MKIRTIVFSLTMLASMLQLPAQNPTATDKNTVCLSVGGNTLIASGNLFHKEGHIATHITVSPSYYVAKNLFVGAHLTAEFTQSNDEWRIGPQAGYSFNFTGFKHFPYVVAGVSYTHSKQPRNTNSFYLTNTKNLTFKGTTTQAGLGCAFNLSQHFILNIEFGFQQSFLRLDTVIFNITDMRVKTIGFYSGLGFSILLF